MKCPHCFTKLKKHSKFCPNCGWEFGNQTNSVGSTIYCPGCGSDNIRFVTKQKGPINAQNACCGMMFFGPLGLLCGFRKNRQGKTVRKCMNCNREF